MVHFVCETRQEKSCARARTRLLRSMLESHSSYGSLQACQSWLPDFLTATNPSAAAAGGKVQRAQVQQANRCLQEFNDEEERVCAHCGTSKTPLWRNGPQGPKVFFYHLLYSLTECSYRKLVLCVSVLLTPLCTVCFWHSLFAMHVGFVTKRQEDGQLLLLAQNLKMATLL